MSTYSELKRLAEAATQGLWERTDGNEVSVSHDGDEAFWSWEQAGPAQVGGSGKQSVADADFIAAAHPEAVLALIAENERLKTFRSKTEQELKEEMEVWKHGPSCWSCGDTGDVHDMVGEWRGKCDCFAAQLIDALHERDHLKAEVETLRDAAAVSAMRIKELDLLFGRYILAMRAAIIEDEHGKTETAGMDWIFNSLAGPGELPPEGETDAQAYFDREIVAVDKGMEEVLAFHDRRRAAKTKGACHE